MNYLSLYHRKHWNPFTELQGEMGRFIKDFWMPATRYDLDTEWSPSCDVKEAGDHYMLSLEMAGIPKDQIKIELHDNQLMISGERQDESKKEEKEQWYSERSFGKFQRSFRLPAAVDPEQVEASYQNGMLQVRIPKVESAKPRQIRIKSQSDV